MGSMVSSAYAALCSFVNAQLDEAEKKRLSECFPHLRDLPVEEREEFLRWLMKGRDKPPLSVTVRDAISIENMEPLNYVAPEYRRVGGGGEEEDDEGGGGDEDNEEWDEEEEDDDEDDEEEEEEENMILPWIKWLLRLSLFL